MRYLPKSDAEREAMLRTLGVGSADELFASIPGKLRLQRPLKLPRALSEFEILDYFRQRAAENSADYIKLLGAGAYDHFRPVVVDALISRGEFLTAYTPYQAEISQGTLQSIFEFQTLLCQLTGQGVANASVYDGSTALAEAVLMALRISRRPRVLVARSVHPGYRETIKTYLEGGDTQVEEIPYSRNGQLDAAALKEALDDRTAVVAIASPNFFGCLEEVGRIVKTVHKRGALLLVAVAEPVSLGLVRPPADADIVALEAQPLGLPPSYGGPYAGVIACQQKFLRSLPGRLSGQATDQEGRRGFVLTLATREQHIRREKATSNICTNQALCALAVTIWLSLFGKQGLRELAEQNLAKAHYLAGELTKLPGVRRAFGAPFFNEFVVELEGDAEQVYRRLQEKKIVAGVPLGRWYPERKNALLLCATETLKRPELDRVVAAFKEVLAGATVPAVKR